MQLRVLVLDYDGTIARDGVLDPDVRTAIATIRERGLVVILATGRILDDLRRVTGNLLPFDAIVAENGAVFSLPATGRSSRLADAPPPGFVAELRRRGVELREGCSVIELAADDANVALQTIRSQELPLTLHFNRGRLMILPQAVSKATGLREVLRTLRLSSHNAVAIGDAENDHELLRVCEYGVAAGWGSGALQRSADEILPGSGPEATAPFLLRLATQATIPLPLSPRHRLLLGQDPTGEVVSLAVHGRNVLVAGDPRSGKSWVAGLLSEQLVVQQYCTCVIDPEGDYGGLEALPGVVVLGDDRAPTPIEIARALRHADTSVVVDLSRRPPLAKRADVLMLLRLLTDLRRRTGLPHRIVVDEAHYFLHDAADAGLLDLAQGGHTLITYRASALDPTVLRSMECVIVTRETDPSEARRLHQSFAGGAGDDIASWSAVLSSLQMDEAVLLPVAAEAGGRLRRIRIAPRLTRHVRHRHKYFDVPTACDRAFRFESPDGDGPVVASLGELARALVGMPLQRLRGHVARGDISRWIGDVFADVALADAVRAIERQHSLGLLPDFNGAVVHAIHARYGDSHRAT